MANIIGIQELVNGPRNYHVKIDIEGDGSGDETAPVAEVDYLECGSVRLDRIFASLGAFSAHLDWDGATKVPFVQIPASNPIDVDWSYQGGLTNPKMANYTGNVNLVTVGLGAGEKGTITLEFVKKDLP